MNSKFKIENFPSRRIDGVEQWLIDICEPEEAFTMFDWLELARMVLEEIWSRGKTPIVVGGTGLYVQALIEGFEVEKTKEQKDKKTEEQFTRKELETKSKEELAEILINLDEEAFLTIDLNNPYRMVRAIEKAQSGEKLTKNDPGFEYLLIGKELPREELYSKIDRRVDEWFEEGFYEEVESLLESGVSLEWLNKIGLEYRILAQYIVDQKSNIKRLSQADSKEQIENSFDDMRQAMKYAIHQYARRQLIWWRRFDAKWIKDKESALMLAKDFLDN